MIKIVFVISDIEKARNFEWIARKLDPEKFEQCYILLNNQESEFEWFLRDYEYKTYRFPNRSKKDLLRNIFLTRKILRREKADIVHCHLMEANRVGLVAGLLARTKKRIYTRHFSTFHHVYFPRAVWIDRILNAISTHIIAISKNVEDVLIKKEEVNPKKIRLIHHGFKFTDYENVSTFRVDALKNKYKLPGKEHLFIGVIARFTHWKGLQYIIPAFEYFLGINPLSHLILANAFGDYEKEVHKMLEKLPKGSYTLIDFEPDSPALYRLFDIYVHTPIDDHSEAFGQTYIEAIASGLPCIFTKSGVAKEFLKEGRNALIVPFEDDSAIVDGLKMIATGKYSNKFTLYGQEDIKAKFSLKSMMGKLEDLYLS